MKTMYKFLGIIALVAIIGFSMLACGSPSGGPSGTGDGDEREAVSYEVLRNNINYSLTISPPARGRAAHLPGDAYALMVKNAENEQISSGKVVEVTETGFVLQPSYERAATFTIRINLNNGTIVSITGNITFNNGTTSPGFAAPGGGGGGSSGGGGGGSGTPPSGTPPGPPTPVITITTQPAEATYVTFGNISGSLTVAASVTEGATLSYQWFWNTTNSNTGGIAVTGVVPNPSFTIPTTLIGETHYYFVEVRATGGATSVRSNVATVTVIDPHAPTNLSAVNSDDGEVTLTWTNPASSAGRNINVRVIAPDVPTIENFGFGVGSPTIPTQTFTVNNLSGGTLYVFQVYFFGGGLPDSTRIETSITTTGPIDHTPPGEVTDLTYTSTQDRITLTWTDPPDPDLLRVSISISQVGGGGGWGADISPGVKRYCTSSFQLLQPNTEYVFRLTTRDIVGNMIVGGGVVITARTQP